jgi:hypothetical protein
VYGSVQYTAVLKICTAAEKQVTSGLEERKEERFGSNVSVE